jgi:hypothetical protein
MLVLSWLRMKTVGNGRKRYYNIGKTKAVGSEYFYILAIKEYKKNS